MDPDRVHEANFTSSESLLEEKCTGVSEKGSNIGADSEGVSAGGFVVVIVERGNRLGRNAEHVAGVFGVSEDAEGGFVDGDHGAEGLDEAAALDFEKVSGYLLLRNGLCCDAKGLGVVEGAS